MMFWRASYTSFIGGSTYVFFVVRGNTLKCTVQYMAAYIKEDATNHLPLSVCLYACHTCKSEGWLYVNVKLQFLVKSTWSAKLSKRVTFRYQQHVRDPYNGTR